MPIVDARTLPNGHRVEADICIVGSGAAGLSVVRSLLDSGLKVAVLESGGFEQDPATQDLNRGSSVGQEYVDPVGS